MNEEWRSIPGDARVTLIQRLRNRSESAGPEAADLLTEQDARIRELEASYSARFTAQIPIEERVIVHLRAAVSVIHSVENRCMATDGPMIPTTKEITEGELGAIYTNLISALDILDGK